MIKKISIIATALTFALYGGAVSAKVTSAEAAKLGNELTPVGAIKAGNADGSIPAWTGGITSAPAGYKVGDHHLDPFADDQVLYTITSANYKEYADFLSPGQMALFEAYPDTYKMPIYPTRRSASYPDFVYEATKSNAVTAELIPGGNGIKNAIMGIPFPIPENGLEAIDIVKKETFDLILMDINMPLKNGIEATMEIRLFDTTTPIVALTAVEIEEMRHSIYESGMNDIIVKPYDITKFIQTILRSIALKENLPLPRTTRLKAV